MNVSIKMIIMINMHKLLHLLVLVLVSTHQALVQNQAMPRARLDGSGSGDLDLGPGLCHVSGN